MTPLAVHETVEEKRWFGYTYANAVIEEIEESASSNGRPGLVLVRDAATAAVDNAAREYSCVLDDVRLMLQTDAVDVRQCDITRILCAASLCDAFHILLSGHCAPSPR